MFRGYYNQQEEQGFPWEQSEHHHHGHHGHHQGHHFGGPRGQWGRGFEGPRGPWAYGRGFGPGGRFGGFRGQRGPGFGGPRGPWAGRGFGPYGRPEITPEQQVLRSTAAEVMRLFVIAARSSFGNAERQGQLRSFLERARTELLGIVGEAKDGGQQEGQQQEQPNVEQA